MARKNSTRHRPQVVKASRQALLHSVEDRIARRHVRRAVEESYRREPERTLAGGRIVTITFTDPSFG